MPPSCAPPSCVPGRGVPTAGGPRRGTPRRWTRLSTRHDTGPSDGHRGRTPRSWRGGGAVEGRCGDVAGGAASAVRLAAPPGRPAGVSSFDPVVDHLELLVTEVLHVGEDSPLVGVVGEVALGDAADDAGVGGLRAAGDRQRRLRAVADAEAADHAEGRRLEALLVLDAQRAAGADLVRHGDLELGVAAALADARRTEPEEAQAREAAVLRAERILAALARVAAHVARGVVEHVAVDPRR